MLVANAKCDMIVVRAAAQCRSVVLHQRRGAAPRRSAISSAMATNATCNMSHECERHNAFSHYEFRPP
jgi:hypothetical protein